MYVIFLFRQKSSSSDDSQFAELEEAQKTTYVRGRWVMTGSDMDDVQYSVVEPCIPNNGNYSAYATWCKNYKIALLFFISFLCFLIFFKDFIILIFTSVLHLS